MANMNKSNKQTRSNTMSRSNLTDTNFMNRARITCACVDSQSNDYSYDESQYSNESVPMSSDSESESIVQNSSSEESESVYSTAPPDVVISESEKISEFESESVSGISSDQESDESTMFAEINVNNPYVPVTTSPHTPINKPEDEIQNWSATATMEEMVRAEGPQIRDQTFQVFVSEMIRDKCWDEEDFKDFMQSMQTIQVLINAQTDDDRLALLLNPKYFNAIHDILDKLDTINVMCAFGTGNKCAMIADPKNREYMRQQVMVIGKLVDVYTPIFVRMLLLMEKFTKELSQEQSCNLDPNYLATINMIKERVVGTLYMRKIQNMDPSSQNKALRDMSNDTGEIEDSTEHFTDNCNSGSSDYLLTFLLLIVAGVIIYIIVSRE